MFKLYKITTSTRWALADVAAHAVLFASVFQAIRLRDFAFLWIWTSGPIRCTSSLPWGVDVRADQGGTGGDRPNPR
jgi:hypothetical protein